MRLRNKLQKERYIPMAVDLEGVIRVFCLVSGASMLLTGILRLIFSLRGDASRKKDIVPALVSLIMGVLVILLLPTLIMMMIFK